MNRAAAVEPTLTDAERDRRADANNRALAAGRESAARMDARIARLPVPEDADDAAVVAVIPMPGTADACEISAGTVRAVRRELGIATRTRTTCEECGAPATQRVFDADLCGRHARADRRFWRLG